MRSFAIGLIIIASCVASVTNSHAQKLCITRHAEKVPKWQEGDFDDLHPLSLKGLETSEKLAQYFKKGSVTAIYSSPTTRTLHTVLPLSQKKELKIQVTLGLRKIDCIETFFEELRKKFSQDDTIILVSHSEIIPHLLLAAGVKKEAQKKNLGIISVPKKDGEELQIEGYGNLWIINNLSDPNPTDRSFEKASYLPKM